MFENVYIKKLDAEVALKQCADMESNYAERHREFLYGYRIAISNMQDCLLKIHEMSGDDCFKESINEYIDERIKDVERSIILANM